MDDPEFRAAATAFIRAWTGKAFEGREEDFEDMVNQLIAAEGSVTQILRRFHAKHGRYPTIDEICPPGGFSFSSVPDI